MTMSWGARDRRQLPDRREHAGWDRRDASRLPIAHGEDARIPWSQFKRDAIARIRAQAAEEVILVDNQSAQTTAEYAVVLGVITLAVVVILSMVAPAFVAVLTGIVAAM